MNINQNSFKLTDKKVIHMDNKKEIFLSESEKTYLKGLLSHIHNEQYVFIVSPNGMSRRTIINESIKKLKSQDYACHYFDMQEMSYLGVYSLYEAVLYEIAGNKIEIRHKKKASGRIYQMS